MFLAIGLGLMILALFFQANGDGTAVPGVVPIVEGIAAATMTGYLVGFFKKARPTASAASTVAVAIAAGLFSAVITSMVNGGIPFTQVGIGTIITQGIGAAALSAGVHEVNKKKPAEDEAT